MSKVVVIDDEPFILMMLEDQLRRYGIDVVTLRESRNALDVIRREMPDLIILDWMMPEVSGLEVCTSIKKDAHLSKIPIFMLTAKDQDTHEQLGLKCGVARYITKPFSPRALVEMVREVVGKK
ncbi:MAG: response regulator [Candidatus Sulfobium sp.]|jgi:DNA-binding response OmpR family regulator